MTRRVHACLECGNDTHSKGDFCCTACRSSFNNRRKARGAELYDFFMAHRFDRAEATRLGFLQSMNRLASNFRQEDKDKRDGRRSWRKPQTVIEERPYLKAIVRHELFGRAAPR